MAKAVRDASIAAEVYPDAKKLVKQLRYAEQKGHRAVVIFGPDEQEGGTVKIRDMRSRSEQAVPLSELTRHLAAVLA